MQNSEMAVIWTDFSGSRMYSKIQTNSNNPVSFVDPSFGYKRKL